ncbi:thiamine-phosphate diphosphorylase [Aliiruegeria haliotis]|uniref:Thiamine-phosphate synthase n=1 Tax=Aliiruegeria haliotis TaxID=1280846 RepID=A0A2T0RWA0_9RHOB|nr:thiamine phosphate synthase [Aliiruegeria haliotis]PRY25451.1 thiamine-phosphate diphosphorylase [Aliiruegeria haliotis]
MRGTLDLSVYLVLDPGLCAAYGMADTTRAAVTAGVRTVQLRHKTASTAEMVAIGRQVQAVLAGTGSKLVVNDDVAAAIELQADALHIGQGDMPPEQARHRIGPDMILGLSVENVANASAVDPAIVDYVGVGPVFATATKSDHATPLGFDGLARVVAECPVPAVAIGGLGAEHAGPVLAAGAEGLAVVSAICGQPKPEAASRKLIEAVQREQQE